MTQDEIMEMARQTGWHDALLDVSFVLPMLTDFAKLVAAKAIVELKSQEPYAWVGLTDERRKQLINKCWNEYIFGKEDGSYFIEWISVAIEAELKEKNT
jgi:hypothetical protein